MAKKKRHPVGRVRTAIAGVDLFFPHKSKSAKMKKVKKVLRRIEIETPEGAHRRTGASAGILGHRNLLRRSRLISTEKLLAEKPKFLHEIAHFFEIEKNDMLVANAITGYFIHLFRPSKFKSSEPSNHTRALLLRYVEEITKLRKIKKLLANLGEFETQTPVSELGFKGPYKDFSISYFARELGFFAVDKEKQWKKPASGLFLIREVCSGVPVEAAVKKIESGKLDKEINSFAKKHLANILSKAKE